MAKRSMTRRRGQSDTIVFAAVAVLVIVVGALLLGYVSTEKTSTSSTSSGSSSTSSSTSSSVSVSGTPVSIPSGSGTPSGAPGYSPDTLHVTTGTTVTWTNNDNTAHTVTSATGNGTINSGNMAAGATYSFTFDTPGTYNYICTYHYWMKGTVVVTGAPVSGNGTSSSSST